MPKEKRVAIITGSSSGIGAATARELAGRGWNVVINYSKSAEAAKKVVAAEKPTKKPSQKKGKSVKGVSSKSKKS